MENFQDKEVTIIKYNNLSEAEITTLLRYDTSVTHLNRDVWLKEWLQRENFDTYVAFKEVFFDLFYQSFEFFLYISFPQTFANFFQINRVF